MRIWLKNLRTSAHLTMKEMGDKLGVSESYYCAIENGERQKKMDIALAASLASIFNLPIAQIVRYEVSESSVSP